MLYFMVKRGVKQGQKLRVRPKLRHIVVFNEMVENGGNASKAVKKAGYKPSIVKNPQKVTQTKGFQQLAATEMPSHFLLTVHKEGLKSTKHVESVGEVPDYSTRHKYLESAYKILGHIKPDASSGHTFVFIAPDQQKRIAARVIDMPHELTGSTDASETTKDDAGHDDDTNNA